MRFQLRRLFCSLQAFVLCCVVAAGLCLIMIGAILQRKPFLESERQNYQSRLEETSSVLFDLSIDRFRLAEENKGNLEKVQPRIDELTRDIELYQQVYDKLLTLHYNFDFMLTGGVRDSLHILGVRQRLLKIGQELVDRASIEAGDRFDLLRMTPDEARAELAVLERVEGLGIPYRYNPFDLDFFSFWNLFFQPIPLLAAYFLLIVISVQDVTQEFQNGSYKNIYSISIGRTRVMLAKYAAITLRNLAIFALPAILISVFIIVFFGVGEGVYPLMVEASSVERPAEIGSKILMESRDYLAFRVLSFIVSVVFQTFVAVSAALLTRNESFAIGIGASLQLVGSISIASLPWLKWINPWTYTGLTDIMQVEIGGSLYYGMLIQSIVAFVLIFIIRVVMRNSDLQGG